MSDASRLVLEEIIVSDTATPGQRLDAIRELDLLRVEEPPFWREVMLIPDEQLDRELDVFLLPIVHAPRELLAEARGDDRPDLIDDVLSDAPQRFPKLAAAVAEAIEARAREIASADRIDAEIERRANEIAAQRADQLVAARLRALEAGVSPRDGAEAEEAGSVPLRVPAIHAGTQRPALPPGVDPDAGWPRRRPGRRSLLDRL